MAQRNIWKRPQLVVLGRAASEEMVLTHCKSITPAFAGAIATTQNGCNQDATKNCGTCQARSGS